MNFLLSKDDPSVIDACSNQLQVIRIVGTEDVPICGGSGQMMRVRCTEQAPIPRRDGLDTACSQLACNLHRHILIQIKAQSYRQRASPSIPAPF